MTTQNIIGKTYLYDFGEGSKYQLHFVDETHLEVTVVEDNFYAPGTINHFDIQITTLAEGLSMITWIEEESKNTVTHVDDFNKLISYTNITSVPNNEFWRLKGKIIPQ